MQTVAETNNASSPVPIVDSEILNEIPLPGEVTNTPKTEDSDKESPPEDSPAIPSTENDIEDKENILEENNTQNKIVLKYTYKEGKFCLCMLYFMKNVSYKSIITATISKFTCFSP